MNGTHTTTDGLAKIIWSLKEKEHGPVFSACGEIKEKGEREAYCCGQCIDVIALDYPNDEMVQRIYEVWKDWHLNDTHAGLPIQEKAIDSWIDQGNRYEYSEVCKLLERQNLLTVEIPEGAKALGGFGPCKLPNGQEVDGWYTYGHRWVYTPIPDDVLAEIRSWAD